MGRLPKISYSAALEMPEEKRVQERSLSHFETLEHQDLAADERQSEGDGTGLGCWAGMGRHWEHDRSS